MQSALQSLEKKWPSADMNEDDEEKWLDSLIKAEVRPLVCEEIRLAVDTEMRETMKLSKASPCLTHRNAP